MSCNLINSALKSEACLSATTPMRSMSSTSRSRLISTLPLATATAVGSFITTYGRSQQACNTMMTSMSLTGRNKSFRRSTLPSALAVGAVGSFTTMYGTLRSYHTKTMMTSKNTRKASNVLSRSCCSTSTSSAAGARSLATYRRSLPNMSTRAFCSTSTTAAAAGDGPRLSASPHEDLLYFEDVISEQEAEDLVRDCDRKLLQPGKKYLGRHFDSVIQDYKETEMPLKAWSKSNQLIIKRLFSLALRASGLPDTTPVLSPHVIDLKEKTGEIHPHVDSLKHGGAIVASLSLLSTRKVLLSDPPKDYVVGERLQNPNPHTMELELKPRTFYILTKKARYDLAHAITTGEARRISIVFRDQPADFIPDWAKEFMGSETKN